MALTHSPSIVRDGLVLHLDAANVKSYPGSGTSATNLLLSKEFEGADTTTTWSGNGFEYKSVQDAATLGFTYGPSDVKGESDVISSACSGALTFEQALAWAHDAGARLPTIDEVYRQAAKGSGCGYDAYLVWTADPVPGTNGTQHYCVYGAMTTYRTTPVATGNTSTAYVRYVAEVDINRTDPVIIIDDLFLKNWLENYYSTTITTIPNSYKYFLGSGLVNKSNTVLSNGVTAENGYFLFDGVNDFITTNKTFINSAEVSMGDSSYSIEAWIWVDCDPGTGTSGAGIIGTDGENGIGLQLTSGIKVNFGLRSTSNFDSASIIEKSRWYHVVGVREVGVDNKIYINAVVDQTWASSNLSVLQPTSTEYIKLGYISGRLSTPFGGRIGSAAIYNRALSEEEIQQNFEALRGRYGI